MNKIDQLNDISWYVDKIKKLTVNGNVLPKNLYKYYPDEEKKISKYLSDIGISLKDFSNVQGSSIFENFIMAGYKDLVKIKNKIKYNKADTVPKKLVRIYNKFSKNNINNLIVSKFNIKVCPYCNENYIINRGKNYTSAQLDHFFDKSNNPLLAICLYNLIPVCATCNRIKSTNKLSVSPFDMDIDREQFHISYKLKAADFITNKDSLTINFQTDGSDGEKINCDIEKLCIKGSYEFHNDYIQELLKKRYIYSDSQIEELYNTYPNLFESEEELIRIIFGNYFHTDDLNKRPLSKLTKDILQELGLK